MVMDFIKEHPKATLVGVAIISLMALPKGKKIDKNGNIIESDDVKKTLINADLELKKKQIDAAISGANIQLQNIMDLREQTNAAQFDANKTRVANYAITKQANVSNHQAELQANVSNHQISAQQDVSNNQIIASGIDNALGFLGDCYITTIVCEVHGFSDDCEFLQTLRDFRKVQMIRGVNRQLSLMYEDLSPLLTMCKFSQAEKVLYFSKYMPIIQEICHLIDVGDYENAVIKYLDMTRRVYKLCLARLAFKYG